VTPFAPSVTLASLAHHLKQVVEGGMAGSNYVAYDHLPDEGQVERFAARVVDGHVELEC